MMLEIGNEIAGIGIDNNSDMIVIFGLPIERYISGTVLTLLIRLIPVFLVLTVTIERKKAPSILKARLMLKNELTAKISVLSRLIIDATYCHLNASYWRKKTFDELFKDDTVEPIHLQEAQKVLGNFFSLTSPGTQLNSCLPCQRNRQLRRFFQSYI